MVKHVTSVEEFEKEIKEGKVLVDFFATWCGPCKMLTPIIEKVAGEHPELKVLKIDVDEVGELAARFEVQAIPTLLYFEDGEQKDRAMGYVPEVKLLSFVRL